MRYQFVWNGKEYELTLERQGAGYRAVVDGQSYPFEMLEMQPGQLSLRFDNRPVSLFWAADQDGKWISLQGCTYRLGKASPRRSRQAAGSSREITLRAPMPAQVLAIRVSVGEMVEAGQTLLLLEAMKMEIRLPAPRRGQIARILVREGEMVARDQILVEFGDNEQET
jgi:biotin carboxyl carrier protein